MDYRVIMTAFMEDSPVRIVNVPDYENSSELGGLLDEIFHWGQNDFQSRPLPSVSVGDVICLGNTPCQLPRPNKYFMVASVGFIELTEEEVNTLVETPLNRRRNIVWSIEKYKPVLVVGKVEETTETTEPA
jgi:hypothetical protein